MTKTANVAKETKMTNGDNPTTTMPILNEVENEEEKTMTNAISMPIVNLDELKEKAAHAVLNLSKAHSSDSVKQIDKARIDAQSAVADYNNAYEMQLFDTFLQSDNPVFEAVKQGYYPKMRLLEKNGKEGVTVDLGYADQVIDLQKLDKAAEARKITNETRWLSFVEKLVYMFSIRAAKDLGGDVKAMQNKYAISEYARSLKMGDDSARAKDPASNNSLIQATQEALNAILFVKVDGKDHSALRVITADLFYILYTSFKKGKGNVSVSMPRTNTMVATLTEVAFRLVNDLQYTAEYKEIQKKEVAA